MLLQEALFHILYVVGQHKASLFCLWQSATVTSACVWQAVHHDFFEYGMTPLLVFEKKIVSQVYRADLRFE